MMEGGLPLLRVGMGLCGKGSVVAFDRYTTFTDAHDARLVVWDQVWFCTDSTALDNEEWLAKVLPAVVGEKTVVVNTTPGLDDLEKLAKYVPEDRLIQGGISFIAWQAPLPEEAFSPAPADHTDFQGIAYWTPPLEKSPFGARRGGGRGAHVAQAIVADLVATGLPAKVRVTPPWNPISEALAALIMGLELDGWSLARARALSSSTPGNIAKCAAECYVCTASRASWPRLAYARFFLFAFVIRVVMWVAPVVVPMDFDAYLKFHFLKVGKQMRQAMDERLAYAREKGIPMPTTMVMREELARIHREPPFDQRV